jgi:hypothetical protein
MHERAPQLAQKRISWVAFTFCLGFFILTIVLADSPPATALPLLKANVYAIPAFARKYGMPCSSCHEAWPKLSPFGQSFKDNGYQMGNDRDAPIFQQPAYWPATFRITPIWHRESLGRVAVDGPGGTTVEQRITTHGFDWTGLDFHTGGTLAKNVSFYVLPSSDNTGAFHFESVWARLDNLLGSTWLNIKLGKFELDNLHSEKRILTLSNLGGFYENYHFQPPGEAFYKFGIGDNQVGAEWLGHSKDDRTRLSAALLNSNDGQPSFSTNNGAINAAAPFATGRAYDGFFTASRAFQAGSLGVQRVGGFAFIGRAPTFSQFTQFNTPGGGLITGTGIGNKGFYRAGLIGMWYVRKLDITTIYFHGWDSAFLGTNTPANVALPAGAHAPTWNGGLFETHYNFNPQLILINRYELVRMSRQAAPIVPGSVGLTTAAGIVTGVPSSDFGNLDQLTFGYRYYPFISSRAGFAFHNEFSIVRFRKMAPISGADVTNSSALVGFDFAF